MIQVLIVEPDKAFSDVLQRYLADDFKVTVGNDAQAAILAADGKKPDIVVLEIAMAQHNGVAFLQEFRSYADWMQVPVIIYSHIPREDIGLNDIEWQKLGVVEYLYKTTTKLSGLSAALNRHAYETA